MRKGIGKVEKTFIKTQENETILKAMSSWVTLTSSVDQMEHTVSEVVL